MSTELSNYRIELDLKPGLSAEELDARILRDFSEKKNRDFANSLDELLPRSFIPYVIKKSGIDPETKVHQITKAQRLELVSVIKAFGIKPVELGDIEGAVITAGGVSVKEVDPKTMESKLCPGLYFAGEVLDLDAESRGKRDLRRKIYENCNRRSCRSRKKRDRESHCQRTWFHLC